MVEWREAVAADAAVGEKAAVGGKAVSEAAWLVEEEEVEVVVRCCCWHRLDLVGQLRCMAGQWPAPQKVVAAACS